jgi:hypothetical protein
MKMSVEKNKPSIKESKEIIKSDELLMEPFEPLEPMAPMEIDDQIQILLEEK